MAGSKEVTSCLFILRTCLKREGGERRGERGLLGGKRKGARERMAREREEQRRKARFAGHRRSGHGGRCS